MAQLDKTPVATIEHRATNIACHDLCVSTTPPAGYRSLLGLGLKYCIRPRNSCTPTALEDMLQRFRRDVYVKTFFADSPSAYDPDQLWTKSTWAPNDADIPIEIRARVTSFCKQLKFTFASRSSPPNLTPIQRSLLRKFRNDLKFIVIPADKNLGLCIIEREEYVRRVFTDHLLDPSTYLQLTEEQAISEMKQVATAAKAFVKQFTKAPTDMISYEDATFLLRSFEVEDPFSYFYGTAKVHKDPWKLRPIVSYSGSLLHGLGRWLNKQLQPYVKELPSYLSSSLTLKAELAQIQIQPGERISMFTCDAKSMYTNISTDHALLQIGAYLRKHPQCSNASAIMQALSLLMRNNIFRFGDTYWKQLTGTAMGAPPACDYAELYFGIHELAIISLYPNLRFYRRYIDDGFGFWHHDSLPTVDYGKWLIFQEHFCSYGSLTWDFSDRASSINFLDLQITIPASGPIRTTIYEKPLNLYQYLPPNSAHSPSVIKGFISGLLSRIFRLTSTHNDQVLAVQKLFDRLQARGYAQHFLIPIFRKAFQQKANNPQNIVDFDETVFLHTHHHPYGPSNRLIQQQFESVFLRPPSEPPFFHLTNCPDLRYGAKVKVRRLVVAQHRVPNLKNLLFPRSLRTEPTRPVSTVLSEVRPNPTAPLTAAPRRTVNPYI
jgi:hypothetical protein